MTIRAIHSFIMPWLLATTALFGLILLIRGWRGKRLDDHPHCRACDYDLRGVESPVTCPECGRALSRGRAVRHGLRRVRWLSLICGSCVLLIGVACGGVLLWARATDFNWCAIEPEWLLLRQVDGQDRETAADAEMELFARLANGGLSRKLVDEASMQAIGEHRSASGQAHWSWRSSFICQAWMTGDVGDDVFRVFVQSMMTGNPRMQARSNVRQGTEQIILLRRDVSGFDMLKYDIPGLTIETRFGELTCGERSIAPLDTVMVARDTTNWPYQGEIAEARARIVLPPGMRTLTAEATTRVGVGLNGPNARFLEFKETLTTNIGVFSGNRPDVDRVPSESVAADIGRFITANARWITDRGGVRRIKCKIATQSLPATVAFEVVLQRGGDEAVIGQFAAAQGDERTREFNVVINEQQAWLASGPNVDVLLRPCVAEAEVTPGIFSIWDGELRIPGVSIVR